MYVLSFILIIYWPDELLSPDCVFNIILCVAIKVVFSFSSLCIILCSVGRSKELKNLNYTEWCKGTLDNTVSTLQSLPSA